MEVKPFVFSGTPRIMFGAGSFAETARAASAYGTTALVVTGASSLASSGKLDTLISGLAGRRMTHHVFQVKGEPSPDTVDRAVREYAGKRIHVVIAVGGGSVVDAGKAISAMLAENAPVQDFLEGMEKKKPSGIKAPFIALPTTAGTGSEATKNAVLSRVGPGGFKRSLRHDAYVPDVAIVDPELTLGCPPALTAACGMDALSQVLESFLSTKANPMTDALARSALAAARDTLVPACTSGAQDVGMRSGMSYASLISGITLAQAGLGVVHGIAGPLGGMFRIPHGAACGTLLGACMRRTVERASEAGGAPLERLAEAGRILSSSKDSGKKEAAFRLADIIDEWTERLALPRLGAFGIQMEDIDAIALAGNNKNNPVELTRDDMRDILASRL